MQVPVTLSRAHPLILFTAYKGMGARSGYSTANGMLTLAAAVINAGIIFLKYIPTEVTVGLLVWIGIVITALAFDEDMHTSKAHGIAVVVTSYPHSHFPCSRFTSTTIWLLGWPCSMLGWLGLYNYDRHASSHF